jgi:hypothetical protein
MSCDWMNDLAELEIVLDILGLGTAMTGMASVIVQDDGAGDINPTSTINFALGLSATDAGGEVAEVAFAPTELDASAASTSVDFLNFEDVSDGSLPKKTLISDFLSDQNIAPAPAPPIDSISINSHGSDQSPRLSFGPTAALTSPSLYTNVDEIGVSPYVLTAVGANSTKSADVFLNGIRVRLGVFNTPTQLSGILAEATASADSYPANAWDVGNGTGQGTLGLYLNGNLIYEIADLDVAAVNNLNGNSSGFVMTTAGGAAIPVTAPGGPFPTFQYRTGTWQLGAAEAWRFGHNYVQVIHTPDGGSARETNYVDWVWDDDDNDTTYGSTSLSLTMAGSRHLSGVEYHTSGSGTYGVTISNGQLNTYFGGSPISVTESSGTGKVNTFGNHAFVNVSGPNDALQTRAITDAYTLRTNRRFINDSITARTSVNRTFNGNESNDPGGSETQSNILMDPITSPASTDLTEDFNDENYRIPSNADFNTDLSSTWDETISLVSATAGYSDGLQVVNGICDYPNFDYSALPGTNDPGGNPNYSGASGTRYIFRYFTNAAAAFNFIMTIGGVSGAIQDKDAALSGNQFRIAFRMPTQTGWMDLRTDFSEGSFGSTSEAGTDAATVGCRSATLGDDTTTPTLVLGFTFGSLNTSNSSDKVYMRIETPSLWSGSISSFSLNWGAS